MTACRWAAALLLSVAAAATGGQAFAGQDSDQAVAVIRALAAEDMAVGEIGYRLGTANAALCVQRMPEAGLLIETVAQYGKDYRRAAVDILHLTDRPTVAWVMKDGPADRAGLRTGDSVTAIDGRPVAASPPVQDNGTFVPVEAAMNALDAALADGTARLTIDRGGKTLTIDLATVPACKGRFQLLAGGPADATANGIWIQVSVGMTAMAKSPDELAAVLAHELAHNALGHRKAPAAVQRRQELAADRLMPYLLQRAGYDPHAALSVYARFKRSSLGGMFPSATHPGWSARIRAVSAEVDRIAALKAAGEPILPPPDLRPPA